MTPRRHRWRRPAARVLLFAAIGAAATVLVAWVCTLAPIGPGARRPIDDLAWPCDVPAKWPPAALMCTEYSGPGHTSTFWQWSSGGRGNEIIRWRAGLPFSACKVDTLAEYGPPPGATPTIPGPVAYYYLNHDGFRLIRWGVYRQGDLVLPFRPLWPGFALDSAFYGGLTFLVWTGPGFLRRRARRRRGRCIACGYDLRGLAACPECGDAA